MIKLFCLGLQVTKGAAVKTNPPPNCHLTIYYTTKGGGGGGWGGGGGGGGGGWGGGGGGGGGGWGVGGRIPVKLLMQVTEAHPS